MQLAEYFSAAKKVTEVYMILARLCIRTAVRGEAQSHDKRRGSNEI